MNFCVLEVATHDYPHGCACGAHIQDEVVGHRLITTHLAYGANQLWVARLDAALTARKGLSPEAEKDC